MNSKLENNCRYSACIGKGVFLLFIALCVCAGTVSATTYTASDQNANGQYQIVYNVNPDNSQTFKAAGVAYGTMETNDPPSGPCTSCQDVSMSGQYGYALVAAEDSSGNQADAETWLYNGDAHVHQAAGIVGSEPESVGDSEYGIVTPDPGPIVPFTGAWATQCVFSRNASAIIANTDSESSYGSVAEVNAQATGIAGEYLRTSASEVPGDGYDGSVFRVHQYAGAFTPTTAITGAYSGIFSLPSVAVASQEGTIMGAATASVMTNSATENGLSSIVSASVTGSGLPEPSGSYSSPSPFGPKSYLDFDMYSASTNVSGHFTSGYGTNEFGSEYKAESEAEIYASGTSGTTNTFSSGPNGQYAGANAVFTTDSCWPRTIDIDLSADSKLNDHVEVTKVENELYGLKRYEGTVTAFNSAGDNAGSTFDENRHASGAAGVVSDAGSGIIWAHWARTWPPI